MSKGVLLVNLGSPDSPSVPDVRRYLNEFLMDGRVIDVAWPLRRFIVGMILINRPKESGHAYEKIWTKDGSPLVVTSKHVQAALQKVLQQPATKAAARATLLKFRTQLDSAKLTPALTDAARSLIASTNTASVQLGARLAAGFKLAAVEPGLVIGQAARETAVGDSIAGGTRGSALVDGICTLRGARQYIHPMQRV